MVSLSPRFTLLAVFCSLAAISLSPLSASGVALQARHLTSSKHSVARDSSRQHAFILPLPMNALKKSAGKKNKDTNTDSRKGKQHKARLTNFSLAKTSLRLADPAFGRSKRHYRGHHEHEKIIVEGNDSHVHVHRRSSVIIPGRPGQSYVVSPARHATLVQRSIDSTNGQAYFDSENDHAGVPGRIDIMSPAATAQEFKRIASLWLDGTFTFKASETNFTEMQMVDARGASASDYGSGVRLVRLEIPVFNPSSPSLLPFCVTTNMQEGSSAMTAEQCSDSQGAGPTANQLFDYNVGTGVIRPTQYVGQDDGKRDDPPDSSDSASPSNGTAASAMSVFGERDGDESNKAENVVLVFLSKAPEAADIEDDPASPEDDPASPEVTVITATSTMTSTFTITTSMTTMVSAADASTVASSDSVVTSAPAFSASAADASPTSAMVSSSIPLVTGTSTMSAEAIDSTPSSGPSSSSSNETPTVSAADASATLASSSTAVPSISSAPSLAALDVQVVAPVSASSDTVSTTVDSTSTSTTPTSSINAEEIASGIAAGHASSTDVISSTVMPTATVTAAAMDASSSAASSADSSSMPSMTPVSTAPYTWMFKVRKE